MGNRVASDLQLIQAYRQGDYQAAGILYQTYWPKTLALCLKYLRNLPDAEDLAQEILLGVIVRKKIFEFRGQSQLWSWLYRITVNACKNQLRKRNKNWNLDYMGIEIAFERLVNSRSPEDQAAKEETSAHLSQALDYLPTKYRKAVDMTYLHDRTYCEASSLLNINIQTLGVRLSRGKKMLASHYTKLKLQSAMSAAAQ